MPVQTTYFGARAAAGRAAVSVSDELSRDVAAEVLRGALHGFLLASAQYDGWDMALAEINKIATAARAPAVIEKPVLKVVRGEVA